MSEEKVTLEEVERLRSEVERLEAELKTSRERHTALWRAVDAHVRAREKGLNAIEGWLWYEFAGAWVAYPPAPIWTCSGCERTALAGIDTVCPGCGRDVPVFGTVA